jgi:hypothetical protein
MGQQSSGDSVCAVGRAAQRHLVQHDPQGVEVGVVVGVVVGVLAHDLFGGHVIRGAQGLLGLGQPRRSLQHPGETKVDEDGFVILGQQHVAWLDVPVKDTRGVSEIQGIGQRAQVPQDIISPVSLCCRVPPGTRGETM